MEIQKIQMTLEQLEEALGLHRDFRFRVKQLLLEESDCVELCEKLQTSYEECFGELE